MAKIPCEYGGGQIQSGSSGELTFSTTNHRAVASISFPKPFNNIPRVILSLTNPNYRNVSICAGSITTSGFLAYVVQSETDPSLYSTTCSFDWLATDY